MIQARDIPSKPFPPFAKGNTMKDPGDGSMRETECKSNTTRWHKKIGGRRNEMKPTGGGLGPIRSDTTEVSGEKGGARVDKGGGTLDFKKCKGWPTGLRGYGDFYPDQDTGFSDPHGGREELRGPIRFDTACAVKASRVHIQCRGVGSGREWTDEYVKTGCSGPKNGRGYSDREWAERDKGV